MSKNKPIDIAVFVLLGLTYFVSVISYSYRIYGLFIVLLLIFLNPVIEGRKNIKKDNIIIPWIISFGVVAVSMITHQVDQFNLLFYVCMLLLLLLSDNSDNWICSIINIVMIMGAFYALMTIFQVLFKDLYLSSVYPLLLKNSTFDPARFMKFGIYSGFTYQTAVNALYLAMGAGATFCSFLISKKARVIKIVLICAEAVCIMMAAKRAHLFFALLGILVVAYYAGGRGKRLRNIIILSFIVFIVFLVAENTVPAVKYFVNKLTNPGDDITNGRTILYKEALRLFSEYPLFGIGWEQFRHVYTRYIDVHNIYLQLLCETGIIGAIPFFCAFIATLICTIKKINIAAFRDNSRDNALILFSVFCQVLFLLYGLTGNALYDYYTFSFYFLGCIIGIRYPKERGTEM